MPSPLSFWPTVESLMAAGRRPMGRPASTAAAAHGDALCLAEKERWKSFASLCPSLPATGEGEGEGVRPKLEAV